MIVSGLTLIHQGRLAPSCAPPLAARGSALSGPSSTVSGDSRSCENWDL
jgi:hypothetical protein